MNLDPRWLAGVIAGALAEDLGHPPRDVTTMATIPSSQIDTAQVVARAAGVLAGVEIFEQVWQQVAEQLDLPAPHVTPHFSDGAGLKAGDIVLSATGATQVLLIGERTGLNLVSRASGVATATQAWAAELADTPAQVLDTRKTTPGLRALEKYAVRCGGGSNKRMGLFDVAMIKDNHIRAAGSISAAFAAVRETSAQVPIQVEVTTVAEAIEAVGAGATFLLCDNMSVELLQRTVAEVRLLAGAGVELEATGGLTLAQARDYGNTGVDFLSVGALTHSSPILDLALDLQ